MSPTWRNDNSFAVRTTNISGESEFVMSGHSIKSYQDLTADGFTQTSPTPGTSPTFNWTVAMIGVAGGAQVITVGKRITGLEIYNRDTSSGEVDITFNDSGEKRAALLLPGRSIEFEKADVWGKVNTVIVESSYGAVVEVREIQ
jgi:hypothetical protein